MKVSMRTLGGRGRALQAEKIPNAKRDQIHQKVANTVNKEKRC